jgi:COP9 signalosome complex subunit 7
MELGANFPAKLEPFLLMSKSAKGAAAAKLIQDATSAPGVFVFAELLDLPNIQELAKSEQHNAFYSLLQLFSYKTFQDYIQHKDALPTLNQAQITKLKHLSIVSLAMERRILPYSDLLQALQMPTIRDLEDLIIDAIYLDILRGKLDQKEQQLEIEYTMGRDLEPGKIEEVLAALKNWASTTSAVLSSLDNKLDSLASQGAVNAANNEEHEKAWQYTLKDIMDKQKDGKGGRRTLVGGGGYNSGYGDRGNERVNVREDPMDVDDAVVENKGKNRKASQEAGSKQQKKRNRFW